MRLKVLALLAIVLLLAPGGARAVSSSQPSHKAAAPLSAEDQAILDGADKEAGEMAAQQELADTKLAQAEEEYEAWTLKDARQAYEWQQVSTEIIFIVVILLMVAGVVFSWIQFRQGMHHPVQAIASTVSTIAQPALSAGNGAQAPSEVSIEKSSAVTEFSASPHGVKIASSTLGVIILVISMCFFYMYLSYVYPVSIQNANQAVSAAKQATGK